MEHAHGIQIFNLVFAKVTIVREELLSSLIQRDDSCMTLR